MDSSDDVFSSLDKSSTKLIKILLKERKLLVTLFEQHLMRGAQINKQLEQMQGQVGMMWTFVSDLMN